MEQLSIFYAEFLIREAAFNIPNIPTTPKNIPSKESLQQFNEEISQITWFQKGEEWFSFLWTAPTHVISTSVEMVSNFVSELVEPKDELSDELSNKVTQWIKSTRHLTAQAPAQESPLALPPDQFLLPLEDADVEISQENLLDNVTQWMKSRAYPRSQPEKDEVVLHLPGGTGESKKVTQLGAYLHYLEDHENEGL